MRILMMSFYYEPDLCPGSFRNSALAKTISDKISSSDNVCVITTMPNRYKSFSPMAEGEQAINNINIKRVKLPSHSGGMIGQARVFLSYAKYVLKETRGEKYDVVYASSSRLMTAFLGAVISRRKSAPLYLDIRDLFVHNIRSMYPTLMTWLWLPLIKMAERFTLRQASRINIVSPFFRPYIRGINRACPIAEYTNGIDDIFSVTNEKIYEREGAKEILYAGNIGDGQGLHKVIPGIATRLKGDWRIRIIGDGGQRDKLVQAVAGLDNVLIEEPVSRTDLADYYRKSSVLLLNLNQYSSLETVIPSKLFEYAASGRPIIAGVSGYTKEFIDSNIENAVTVTPCDPEGFIHALNKISLDHTPRKIFCDEYNRDKIMQHLAMDVMSLCR